MTIPEDLFKELIGPLGVFVLFGTGFLSFKVFDLCNYYGVTRNLASNVSEAIGYGCVNIALSVWWLIPLLARNTSTVATSFSAPAVYLFIVQPILLGLIPAIIQTIARKRRSYFLPIALSSWDWVFSQAADFANDRGFKIVVTLEDGTRIAGLFEKGAYASSDPTSQLYLTRTVNIAADGTFIPSDQKESRGVIVMAKDIRTVELYPGTATRARTLGA